MSDLEFDAYWYFGGIASATACILTHPMDLVRMQIQAQLKHNSAMEVVRLIIKHRGIWGLYFGLGPAVMRQLTYSVTRFGIYEAAKQRGLVDSFRRKVIVAAGSGFIAGLTNTPMDKINVHMRTDAARPPSSRRDYQSVRDGLTRLYREGGMRNLFACAVPSSIRGMVITVGQLSIYDQIKENFINNEGGFSDNWETFFIASLIAGGFTTFITLPIDVIRSIGMNTEFKDYRGNLDIVQSILKENGARGFYKGFLPSLLRIVPQTVLTFLLYEELRFNFGKSNNQDKI